MATYFARGGTTDNITTADKREALAQALKVINRPLRRVLILPPDHTRLNSDAGELTRLLYEMLSPRAEVDIMPTLGTHSPMTEAQLRMMFGDAIPLDRFKVHDWRNGIRQVGEVPGSLLRQWSGGLVDYSVRIEVGKPRCEVGGLGHLASAGILHCCNGRGVRNKWLKRQSLVVGHFGQHQTHGIGHGQSHGSKDSGRFFLDQSINARLYELVCSHGHWSCG